MGIGEILKPKTLGEIKEAHWDSIIINSSIKGTINKVSLDGKCDIKLTEKVLTSQSVLDLAESLNKKLDLKVGEIRVVGFVFDEVEMKWMPSQWKKNGDCILKGDLSIWNISPVSENEITRLKFADVKHG